MREEKVKLSFVQDREIRNLLERLGEIGTPVDLVDELGIHDPVAYIESLRKRTNINLDENRIVRI